MMSTVAITSDIAWTVLSEMISKAFVTSIDFLQQLVFPILSTYRELLEFFAFFCGLYCPFGGQETHTCNISLDSVCQHNKMFS